MDLLTLECHLRDRWDSHMPCPEFYLADSLKLGQWLQVIADPSEAKRISVIGLPVGGQRIHVARQKRTHAGRAS